LGGQALFVNNFEIRGFVELPVRRPESPLKAESVSFGRIFAERQRPGYPSNLFYLPGAGKKGFPFYPLRGSWEPVFSVMIGINRLYTIPCVVFTSRRQKAGVYEESTSKVKWETTQDYVVTGAPAGNERPLTNLPSEYEYLFKTNSERNPLIGIF
jgi:hypothetical protein